MRMKAAARLASPTLGRLPPRRDPATAAGALSGVMEAGCRGNVNMLLLLPALLLLLLQITRWVALHLFPTEEKNAVVEMERTVPTRPARPMRALRRAQGACL